MIGYYNIVLIQNFKSSRINIFSVCCCLSRAIGQWTDQLLTRKKYIPHNTDN